MSSKECLIVVNCEVLRKICQYATDWCCYLGGRHKLQDLVVHLVLNCSSGGEHIFKLFLDAAQDPYKPLSNNTWEVLGKGYSLYSVK